MNTIVFIYNFRFVSTIRDFTLGNDFCVMLFVWPAVLSNTDNHTNKLAVKYEVFVGNYMFLSLAIKI